MSPTQRMMNALQRHVGTAAAQVEQDEKQKQYKALLNQQAQQTTSQNAYTYWASQQQQQLQTQQPITTTAANYQTLGQPATTICYGVTTQYGTTLGGAPLTFGGAPIYQDDTRVTTPTLIFTDEQMSLFMEKLAHLLTHGWECLRCHRIWNPRETGCEFCNFIDRLEGKDVERDTA